MMTDKTKQSKLGASWKKEPRTLVLCPATRLGEDAWIQTGSESHRGVVHSVFDHALNILLPDYYFLTVLSDEYLAIPFGISLRLKEGFSFKDWVKPGETVWIDKNGMQLKSGVFDFTSVLQPKIFSCPQQPCNINKFNFEVLESIHLWVKESFPRGGYYELYDSLSFSAFDEDFSSKDPVVNYAHRLLKKLKKNFLEEKDREAAEILNEFVGLGIGLTPSGDDFILGFLAFCHFLKKPPFCSNIIPEIRKKLINSVSGRTTMISEVYLHYGLNGQFSEILTAFVQGIFIADTEELKTRTLRLLNVGSTSGTDMIAGCLFAMYVSLNKMNLPKRHLIYA